MKYHGHELKKIIDHDVDGGFFYKIYKNGVFITCAWTLNNAKEFIDSFDGHTYNYGVLC